MRHLPDASEVVRLRMLATRMVCVDDGLSPRQRWIQWEEAFEGEDGHLEEVEGEPGDEAGDDEGGESPDDVVVVA